MYPKKIQEMAETVERILDVEAGTVKLWGYNAIDAARSEADELLDDTAAGKFLFEYDPNGVSPMHSSCAVATTNNDMD